jgi:AraC family transcriptional regulator
MSVSPFKYQETHGVVRQAGNRVYQSSDRLGWLSLFASVQSEVCYEGFFPAVKDHLVVVPLRQQVHFRRHICGELQERGLPPGSVTFTPGGADFEVRTSSNAGWYETIHLYVRHELLQEIQAEMLDGLDTVSLPPLVGFTDHMINCIALEVRKLLLCPEEADAFFVETLTRTLAVCLLRTQIGKKKGRVKIGGALSVPQLARAIEFIEEALDENLSVTSIAKETGANAAQLAAGFKAEFGVTPYEYVIRKRVERAKLLLTGTDLSLAEIAYQCGFSHQQHINRVFRRFAGITPGSLRRV